MRFYLLILLLACGVGLTAAQDTKPLIPDFTTNTFSFGGFERTYSLVTPDAYDKSKTYPLVVVFHGAGGTGIDMMSRTALKELAAKQGYVIAFPDGIEKGWGYLDKKDSSSGEVYTEDWNFFAALVDDIGQYASIDTQRVYVVGFSNGGSLAYRIMCEYPERVAGVVVMASTLSSYTATACIGTKPVPLMTVLGTADRTFPFGGSAEIKSDGRLVLQFSFQQQMTFLAQHQSCQLSGGTTSTVSLPNSPLEVVRDFYDQCPGGAPILVYALIDFEHGYGGKAVITREDETVGTLEDAIFDFFAAYPAASK